MHQSSLFQCVIRYAQYSHFKIYSEGEYYKLEIDGYEGNAGDSLNDPWYGSNNSPFSTYNRYALFPFSFYLLPFTRGLYSESENSLSTPESFPLTETTTDRH